MIRETPPGGIGPDRGPRSGKPGAGKQPSKLVDAAMYAATGGAKVAKAGAYVTGGGLVAVYGTGVTEVGAPESTGYESNQFNRGDPAERIFPDLTPPEGGPGPGSAAPELTASTFPASTFRAQGYGYTPPAGFNVSSTLSDAAPVASPSFAEAFPSFSDAPHAFNWAGVDDVDHVASNVGSATDQINNVLHDPQFGGGPSMFSGVGDASGLGIYGSIAADSEVSVDVSVTAGVSTELEINDSGISLEVETSASVSIDVEASAEISATTRVGSVGNQVDNLNSQGGVKSLSDTSPGSSSTSPGNGGSLRGGFGSSGSEFGPGGFGGSGSGGFGSGSSFTAAVGNGLNGSDNGLATPGAQGSTTGAGPTSHGTATFGPNSSSPGMQPVTSTPMQTTIQPDAGLHPIANVTSMTAPDILTAPAASLPMIFGATPHHSGFSAGGSNSRGTSTGIPATGGITDTTKHGSLPGSPGIGTRAHNPFSIEQLTLPKTNAEPGAGGATTGHSPVPGTGGTDFGLPTHTTTGNTATTPTGTNSPTTDTGRTGVGGTDADRFGSDTTPSTQPGSSSTVPQQHAPQTHLPDNSVSTLPGSGLSPTAPGEGVSPGGGTGTLGGHTSPLTPGSPGGAAAIPAPQVPSAPTAPLGGLSPGIGGSLLNPLHAGGASFTLPAHPMDHTDAIGARLSLCATGHGLGAGLMSAGSPSDTHALWTDHHIAPLTHH